MANNALVLLHPGFEELEAVAAIDLLARADVSVTQAATGSNLEVPGRNGMTLKADCLFSELSASPPYEAIVIPGGPGIQKLRNNSEICAALRGHDDAGKIIACICAAPLLLLDAGLLNKASAYTAFPATAKELPDASDEPVVRDGRLITSRGAGTATEFALALVRALCGEAKAAEIADSICWSHCK